MISSTKRKDTRHIMGETTGTCDRNFRVSGYIEHGYTSQPE